MKKNYYKTIRHDYAIIGTISSIICLFFCIIYGYNLKRDELYVFYLLIILGIICIFWFIYSITYNTKRNVFMKKGKPISGYIIGAEEKKAGRGLSSYYLLISFNDEHGNKIKYTEGYVGNPNHYLKSRNCNIYKYKGKYIEADLIPKDKPCVSMNLRIPIHKYRGFSKKKYV